MRVILRGISKLSVKLVKFTTEQKLWFIFSGCHRAYFLLYKESTS